MDSRYTKLAKNSGIMLVGNLSSKLISFLLLPVYTQYLSTEAYGESDMINVYASIFLAIITCCVADAMFVYPKSENDIGKKRFFTSGIVFSIITFSIFAFFLWFLDSFSISFKGGVLLLDKWWIYFSALTMFIQQYCQQFTLSLEKTLNYALAGILLTFLMAILAIVLLPKYGLSGYLLSIVIANIGAALFSFFASKSYRYLSLKFIDKDYTKKLLSYGIPLIPNSLMWWLVNGINRPIMEVQLGLSAIGIYAVANRFPSVLSMIFQVIGKGMSISVIDEFKKGDFNIFYNRILKVLTLSVIVLGIFLCFFSKLIIKVFTDAEYFPSWQYMPLLTLAVIFQCMGGFVGNVFMAEKKSKYFFYSSFWAALTSLFFTFVLINYLGLFGVCLAIVLSFLVLFVTRIYYAWKHIDAFNVKYYVFIFTLYIIFVLIITFDVSIYLQLLAIIVFLLMSYFLNKDDVSSVFKMVKSKKK